MLHQGCSCSQEENELQALVHQLQPVMPAVGCEGTNPHKTSASKSSSSKTKRDSDIHLETRSRFLRKMLKRSMSERERCALLTGAQIQLSEEKCARHRHRAKVKVKQCSNKGCANNAKKGGECIKHGARVKLCSSEGCTNNFLRAGMCRRHWASWTKKCAAQVQQ